MYGFALFWSPIFAKNGIVDLTEIVEIEFQASRN